MRRTLLLLTVGTLLAGCGQTMRQYRITADVSSTDLFSEAQTVLSDMGYTVVDAERDAGLLIAEKEQSGKGMLGEGVHVQRLTVNISDDGGLTITASTRYGDTVTEPSAGAVSDETKADAQMLRDRLTEEAGTG